MCVHSLKILQRFKEKTNKSPHDIIDDRQPASAVTIPNLRERNQPTDTGHCLTSVRYQK